MKELKYLLDDLKKFSPVHVITYGNLCDILESAIEKPEHIQPSKEIDYEGMLEKHCVKFNDGSLHGTTINNILNAMKEAVNQSKQIVFPMEDEIKKNCPYHVYEQIFSFTKGAQWVIDKIKKDNGLT